MGPAGLGYGKGVPKGCQVGIIDQFRLAEVKSNSIKCP